MKTKWLASFPFRLLSSPSPWLSAATIVVWAWIGMIILYWPTVHTLMHTWSHSVSYQHGWAILPLCLYLVWRQRRALARIEPQPLLWGPLLLIPLAVAWFLGYLADVVLVQQISFILMLQTLTVSLLGISAGRILAFPLLYLLFAVPVGEDLIPILQDYTAWFTVKALQLTGIPVYLEGRFLMIPTGTWEVAKSCAGIRYILPSLALGTLFAMLTYQSWLRRCAFLLAAFIVPILANGLRAYGIVMLAYLTDNALAVGVDHFIYGGVFFGIVMFIMFSIGLRWRERPRHVERLRPGDGVSSNAPQKARPPVRKLPIMRLANTVGVALVFAATGPVLAELSHPSETQSQGGVRLSPPAVGPSWTLLTDREPVWQPQFAGYEQALSWLYRTPDGEDVQLYLAWYPTQRQGAELIQSRNVMYDSARWRLVSHTRRAVVLDHHSLDVDEWLLRSPRGLRLVWSWYWIGGTMTADPYWAKWLELRNRLQALFGKPSEAALIALSTSYDETEPTAAPFRLRAFLDQLQTPLERILVSSYESEKT